MLIKLTRLAIALILAGFSCFTCAQSVIIRSGIRLPEDTAVRKQLVSSLNGFLAQKEKPNKENTFVLKEALSETSNLLDEMKGMEQNVALKDKNFYKCYLTNVVKLDGDHFLVQISYIGMTETTPVLRSSIKLIAKKQGDQFYFYSPLKQNTISWKTKEYNNLTCYYKDVLNATDALAYQKKVELYDAKLKMPRMPIQFYFCDNLTDALELVGVEYEMDYNGVKYNSLSSNENNVNQVVNGGYTEKIRFDAHDLWHERLRLAMSRDIINRPVDEGCAYLYGGSWGYSWQEVITKFKKYAADNPGADWLSLYIESKNFEDGDKPLKVPYALDALIVQKIEREKGFAAVMELLRCGKREEGDDNYFKVLEKITGISKANFNASMRELVKGL
ncbi:MAG: hypothetical protein ACXVB0_05755 [Mucilaginibacter sp.]